MVIDTLAVLAWQQTFLANTALETSIDLGGPGWRDIFAGEPVSVGFTVDGPPGGSATYRFTVFESDDVGLFGARGLAARDVPAAELTKGRTVWVVVPAGLARGRYVSAAVAGTVSPLTLSIFAQPGAMQEAQQYVGAGVPFAATFGYSDVIAASRPVGYWRLGEPSGTVAADSSGNGLNGTYINAPTLGVAGAIAADPDKAVTLNGVDEYISVPANPLLALGGSTFTLEVWIKLAGVPAAASAILAWSTFFWYVEGSAEYMTVWKFDAPNPVIARSVLPIPADVWIHVVFTAAGTDMHFYLNGVDSTIIQYPGEIYVAAADFLQMGQYSGGGARFHGALDDVAIYNRALTPGEVADHYTAARRTPYSNAVLSGRPLAYWRFNEETGSGTTAADSSGNGWTGTYVNSPAKGVLGTIANDSVNRAVQFDGAIRYMTTAPVVLATAGGLTMEAWLQVNPACVPDGQILTQGFQVLFGLSNVEGSRRIIVYTDTAAKNALSNFILTSGVWHHVVVVIPSLAFDSSGVIFYLDGVGSAGFGSTGMTITPAAAALSMANWVGGGAGATNQFRGIIDELAIYPRRLSAAEVLQHYRAGAGL